MSGPTTKFVSQKVSKIRWRPVSKQAIHCAEVFATGSWDNEEENAVTLWSLEGNNEDDDMLGSLDGEPQQLCSSQHRGDVMDLRFLTSNLFLTASSNGSLYLFKHHPNSQTLSVVHSWNNLHHLKHSHCACNSIAARGEDCVVTVGEDGRIAVLNPEQRTPVRVIEKGDSCSLNGATFLKQFEIGTINSIGQLKVWDIRQASDEPVKILHVTGDRVPLHCLDKHPTQPHILATGGQEGSLCIWDMRQDRIPVALLTASETDMWEIHFHPSQPDYMLTCSANGSVLLWNASAINAPLISLPSTSLQAKGTHNTSIIGNKSGSEGQVTSPWLACDAAKNRLEITDLLSGNPMPVNSIDIIDTTLICATDGEQILTMKDLPIN